jgi:hypothetical protein
MAFSALVAFESAHPVLRITTELRGGHTPNGRPEQLAPALACKHGEFHGSEVLKRIVSGKLEDTGLVSYPNVTLLQCGHPDSWYRQLRWRQGLSCNGKGLHLFATLYTTEYAQPCRFGAEQLHPRRKKPSAVTTAKARSI